MPAPASGLVDAHEDLAWHCQLYERDLADPLGTACMVTLPGLLATDVRLVCATLFTLHTAPLDVRRVLLREQLDMYQAWCARYPRLLRPILRRQDLAELEDAEAVEEEGLHGRPVGLLLLMEGLESLESPAELTYWFDRGVRLASLTWNGVTPWASGCFGDAAGLTPAGRELLDEFERLGLILDLSHLAAAGVADVFTAYHGPLCASHSNAAALCPHERNLSDAQAAEIAARGGVLGLNLLADFIARGWRTGEPLPSIEQACWHVLHFVDQLGPQSVGLGSDLDGGLTPANTPEGIDQIEDLPRLSAELTRLGLGAVELAAFERGNWWRFFERSLPA